MKGGRREAPEIVVRIAFSALPQSEKGVDMLDLPTAKLDYQNRPRGGAERAQRGSGGLTTAVQSDLV